MNFEHLCKYILNNQTKIKNFTFIKKILSYHYEILLLHRKKLKLGLIHFEMNDPISGLLTGSMLKIKFVNQDTSVDDEQQVENLYKRYTWKWTRQNTIALIITVVGIIYYLIGLLIKWYIDTFPFLYYRFSLFDEIIKLSLNLIFSSSFGMTNININFIDIIFNFCIYFNLL